MSAPDDPARRHRLVGRAFLRVRALPEARRARLLARLRRRDAALAGEVEALLEADADEGFEAGAGLADARALATSDASPTEDVDVLPARIGPFRPRAVLGRGATAVVYLAEQDAPRREVALKVLRGDVSDEAAARIEREADVLARLEHAGLARIYSAGRAATPWGVQGYIAMELVQGRPLLEYARAEGLPLRGRLALVADVAEALQPAHAAGVVHRDLKPSNVLVQQDGTPKLLDFGVARVASAAGAESAHTRTGQIVGTLATMAPEQAAGAKDVDARADVYALGVLLYELCAGRLPVDTRGLPLHEAVRRIQDDEPLPLGALVPELAGDVETIAQRALAKEPARRYRDAGAFAADLRRHLADQPIHARPLGPLERGLRFARRNRPVVVGVGVAFLALAAALAVSLVLLQRARDENRRAGRVREAALRLTDLRRLEQLRGSAEALWPATPARLPALDAWLAEADLLVGKLDWHRELLARLDARLASPGGQARLASPDSTLAGINDEVWMQRAQATLVAGLDAFAATGGIYEELRARRSFAASLGARSVEEHAEAWAVLEDEWPGLDARVGLVPDGVHAATGLPAFRLLAPGLGPDAVGTRLVYVPGAEGGAGAFVGLAPLAASTWDAFPGAPRSGDEAGSGPDGARVLVAQDEAARFAERVGARLVRADEWERLRALGLAPDPALAEWLAPEGGRPARAETAAGPRELPASTRAPDLGLRLARDGT